MVFAILAAASLLASTLVITAAALSSKISNREMDSERYSWYREEDSLQQSKSI